MRMTHRTVAACIIVAVACLFLSGCLIQHKSHISKDSSRHCVWKGRLHNVVPGETTKEWVIKTFGTPEDERHLDNGVEILKYERSSRTRSEFSFFLLIDTQTTKVTTQTLHFDIKDGIVQKYWID